LEPKEKGEGGRAVPRTARSLFSKGVKAQSERQTNKSSHDSRPQESILFSALSGLKDGVHLRPPLLWSLTSNGVKRLRTLSRLALPEVSDAQEFESDIGIICALEYPELSAVIKTFGGAQSWKEIGNARYAHIYQETKLQTNTGKQLKVIATTSTSMGLTAAAIATTQLVLQFRPRIVAMIGILMTQLVFLRFNAIGGNL
jgi:hypothetical protein